VRQITERVAVGAVLAMEKDAGAAHRVECDWDGALEFAAALRCDLVPGGLGKCGAVVAIEFGN